MLGADEDHSADMESASITTDARQSPTGNDTVEIQLYQRRWLMLLVFCSYSATNAFQWLQYSTISNVIGIFYGQPSVVVDWLGIVFELVYIPLIFPANWVLDTYGLMPVALFGSMGNALGACIKVMSARSDLFWLTFMGQTISAIAQIFILGIPAALAGTWFGAKEVSKATAFGVFGNQVGNALGFLLPPLFVPHPKPWNQRQVQASLQTMFYTTAGVTVFQFLCVVFRMCVGTFYSISVLLNQSILTRFPGEDVNVGNIGLLIVITGMIGSVAIGVWLDKTRMYKKTTMVIYALTFAGMALFTVSIVANSQIWLVFIAAGLLGLFMSSYLPLGFEFAAEILYPASEGTTSGLLNCSAQVFGVVLTVVGGQLYNHVSVLSGLLLFCFILAIGAVLSGFIKEDLKRQKAEKGAARRSDGN